MPVRGYDAGVVKLAVSLRADRRNRAGSPRESLAAARVAKLSATGQRVQFTDGLFEKLRQAAEFGLPAKLRVLRLARLSVGHDFMPARSQVFIVDAVHRNLGRIEQARTNHRFRDAVADDAIQRRIVYARAGSLRELARRETVVRFVGYVPVAVVVINVYI